MEHPAGESDDGALRVQFARCLRLECHGSRITSDAGLLPYRELDDVLSLIDLASAVLSDGRRGKNSRHLLAGLLRQSVFGRLAGYEDVAALPALMRALSASALRWRGRCHQGRVHDLARHRQIADTRGRLVEPGEQRFERSGADQCLAKVPQRVGFGHRVTRL